MSRIRRVFGRALAGAALALSVAVPLVAAARAPDVVYNFTGGSEGSHPVGGLIMDKAGNFYGTTSDGGVNGGTCVQGCGAVFKLSPLGVATALHTFTGGSDGARPQDTLFADAAGNLYGTANIGGAHNLGVVFKLTPGGVETVLYSFAGGSDGSNPYAGLIADAAGNFYGTTLHGGPSDLGTVFRLAPDGTETVLHAFTGGRDGSGPYGGVIMDKHGNLYGDTLLGGPRNAGVIFKIAPNGKFSLLYTFTRHADGGAPHGGLIRDKQGNLYGVTTEGGRTWGVVFKLAPDGTQTVLHTFAESDANSEGSLIMDQQGDLFGTTEGGGADGLGSVIQISPDGKETVLHSFTGMVSRPFDGLQPFSSLTKHMNKLYGVTTQGGNGNACASGCGVVFEVRKAK